MIDINFGPQSRLDLIQYCINKTSCKSYLEIGCDKNQIWNNIKVDTMFGVDPARGGNMRMTSDEFFKLKKNRTMFDVIFVDGLHEYQQVTRDVENSLYRLNDGGIIIIHDMLPRTEEMADPNVICKGSWLGDVYKLAFDLSNRSDIMFKLLLIDQGCGVVIKTPSPSSSSFQKADWEYYVEHWTELPLISFEDFQRIF
jgi:hypothetical protein